MMTLSYYPGCALQAMSWDYRESIKAVASALELELRELPDWTCCGATAAHSLDEDMSIALPLRNLVAAERFGLDLAVACPMCFKRLVYCRIKMQEAPAAVRKGFTFERRILDLARFIATEEMLERVRSLVRRPLAGLRVVSFYGCQVVRPPKITGHDDYENPQHLDRLVAAAGAEPVDWSFKATCCGASMGIPKREVGRALIAKLLAQAYASGAQAIVACCPLCQSNLDLYQPELRRRHDWLRRHAPLPVLYYTEILALAFGQEAVRAGLKSHLVDPSPLILSAPSDSSPREGGQPTTAV
jgi:heterodisulfide reductase subunit B2